MKNSLTNKMILLFVGVAMISVISFPQSSHAQAGAGGALASCALGSLLGGLDIGSVLGGGGGGMGSDSVPVNETGTVLKNSNFQKTKDCTLEGMIYALAGDILQKMTDSVVDWINHGFNGSPAFIQNPGGFFLDAADQITGAFISNSGPLASLCNGFGLDIRLSLAMNQTNTLRQRYTCTLSSIIKNAGNAHASVSVGTSPNGTTLGDIMNGGVLHNSNDLSVNGSSVSDTGNTITNSFDQNGGWVDFMTEATNPQNTPVGGYLMARSDRDQMIANQKEQTTNDLNRGNGFLSYTKCVDDAYTATDGGQSCSVVTPGSVIYGSLQKQLDIGADRLNMANKLNQIVGALFTQLVGSVLTNGLASVSTNTSGQNSSTLSQLSSITSQQTAAQFSSAKQSMLNDLSNFVQPATAYKNAKDQILAILKNEQTRISSMLAVCTSKANETGISSLQNLLDSTINPAVQTAQDEATGAATLLAEITSVQTAIQNAQSNSDILTASNQYAELINTPYPTNSDAQAAQAGVANATKTVTGWDVEAAKSQTMCSQTTSGTSFFGN